MDSEFSTSILGSRIKACRQAAGISQEKVAELVGVSRQAVTKWETGQSAPSTENLFKLAEIFGTTVDLILTAADNETAGDSGISGPAASNVAASGLGDSGGSSRTETGGSSKPGLSISEQMYEPHKLDEARKAEEGRLRRQQNLKAALEVAVVYIIYYLTGRVLCVHYENASVIGWLFLNDWVQMDYLYGWLLSSNLFWCAMMVSVIPAIFGRVRFSGVTAVAFAAGWLAGELFGPNPEGAVYGHGHYGWAIWVCVFLVGMVAGAVWQRNTEIKNK